MSHDSASSPSTLDRLLESIVSRLSPDAARVIAEFQPPAEIQARLDELATKNLQDELSTSEHDEYEGVVQVVHAIAQLRAKILTRPQGAHLLEEASRKTPQVKEAVTLDPDAPRLEGLEAMLEDMDL